MSHLLQFQPVQPYFSYSINPKRRYLLKPNGNISTKPSDALNTACHLSNSCLSPGFWQSRMRSRCIKTAFQTPSSTSCMRSTASMPNMLKPNGASLLENAFWQSMSTTFSSWLRGCTYHCQNKWLFLQKVFHYHAINHIAILIYLLVCSINMITLFHTINLGESLALCWISMHPHVSNMIQWYETMGRKALTKITNAGYKNSMKDLSYRHQHKRA